jgi:hypothetical protein
MQHGASCDSQSSRLRRASAPGILATGPGTGSRQIGVRGAEGEQDGRESRNAAAGGADCDLEQRPVRVPEVDAHASATPPHCGLPVRPQRRPSGAEGERALPPPCQATRSTGRMPCHSLVGRPTSCAFRTPPSTIGFRAPRPTGRSGLRRHLPVRSPRQPSGRRVAREQVRR